MGLALAALALAAGPLAAQPEFPSPAAGGAASRQASELPTPLRNVGYDQRLGAQVPIDLAMDVLVRRGLPATGSIDQSQGPGQATPGAQSPAAPAPTGPEPPRSRQ